MQIEFFDSYPYRTLEADLQTLVLGARRVDAVVGLVGGEFILRGAIPTVCGADSHDLARAGGWHWPSLGATGLPVLFGTARGAGNRRSGQCENRFRSGTTA